MSALRLGTLVVLFRPSVAQVNHVAKLATLCAPTVVVDNSPVPDPSAHERLVASAATILVNTNRGGIGGAFNLGLRHLRSTGATAAVLLDQDSTVPAGFFEALARTCEALGEPAYIVGPRVFDVNAKRCMPAITFTRFRLRSHSVDDCPPWTLLPCSFLVSSGSVVSLAAYERIGSFSEDYIVDHVDSDYCLRAIACGVTVAMSCAATLEHQIGRMTTHRLFGVALMTSNHPALRRYYFARNAIRLTRMHGRRLPSVALVNLLTIWQMVAVVLFEADKFSKTVAALAGMIDGLKNRSGPVESCRPNLAKRCSAGAAS
jgi:rhamnosyltransferase